MYLGLVFLFTLFGNKTFDKPSLSIIIKPMLKNPINVLSLFDGISCGQLALQRAGIPVNQYFASEIDKHAIKVTQHNFPDTVQLGSVVDVKAENLPKIDLLAGGSPCQSFSFAGKRNGMSTTCNQDILSIDHYLELKNGDFEFEGYSYLFWEYVRLLKETSPTYFLLENVKMSKKWEKVITNALQTEPIEINSKLVSAQNRRRLYWSNIPNITQPIDRMLSASSIKEMSDGFCYAATIKNSKNGKMVSFSNDKIPTLTTFCGSPNGLGRPFWAKEEFILQKPFDYSKVKKITPIEAERLQTVPDNYTSVISDNKRYHALGNGWTVDVIAHIFKGIS